jgi:FkbM family methyltransferase
VVGRSDAVIAVARALWGGWIKWPMPLWRLRGRGTLTIGGERLVFCRLAQARTGWWAWSARADDYEKPVIDFLVKQLQPGDVFFDIGAFNGMYSMLAARRGARAIAFEPDPRSQDLLQRNIRANRLQCEPVFAAVAATDGKIRLDRERAGHLQSRVGESGVVVEAISLDSFCRERGLWPDVVKIDVEGAERDVLRGGAEALGRARAVVIEFHDHFQSRSGRLLSTRFDEHVLEERWGNVNVGFTRREQQVDR